MGSRQKDNDSPVMYDRMLLWLDAWPGRRRFHYGDLGFHAGRAAVGQRSFLFAKRDGLYILLALGLALVTLRLPMEFWQRHQYGNVDCVDRHVADRPGRR